MLLVINISRPVVYGPETQTASVRHSGNLKVLVLVTNVPTNQPTVVGSRDAYASKKVFASLSLPASHIPFKRMKE